MACTICASNAFASKSALPGMIGRTRFESRRTASAVESSIWRNVGRAFPPLTTIQMSFSPTNIASHPNSPPLHFLPSPDNHSLPVATDGSRRILDYQISYFLLPVGEETFLKRNGFQSLQFEVEWTMRYQGEYWGTGEEPWIAPDFFETDMTLRALREAVAYSLSGGGGASPNLPPVYPEFGAFNASLENPVTGSGGVTATALGRGNVVLIHLRKKDAEVQWVDVDWVLKSPDKDGVDRLAAFQHQAKLSADGAAVVVEEQFVMAEGPTVSKKKIIQYKFSSIKFVLWRVEERGGGVMWSGEEGGVGRKQVVWGGIM